MLERCNGCYLFESALHVRGSCISGIELGLERWNSTDGWRAAYGDLIGDSVFFFAADAFGCQFAITPGGIAKFDPETGAREQFASNLEDWAQRILSDFKVETGWPLMHRWQEDHGALPPGYRLIPVTPFVLGGQYSTDNLRAVASLRAMSYYAQIAIQLRNLPEGTKVRFIVE